MNSEEKKKIEQEKKLLNQLQRDYQAGNFEEIIVEHKNLIKINPDNESYWNDFLVFLYFNYKDGDPYDWDEYIKDGILFSEQARDYLTSNKEISKYFLYEYKFIIELIRFDSSYSEDYNDEKLIGLLNDAIAIYPLNTEAIHEKGNFYQINEEFDKAEIEYNKASELEENEVLINDRALNYELLGKNDKAVQEYLKLYNKTQEDFIQKMSLMAIIQIYEREANLDKVTYYKNLLNDLQ